MALFTVNPCCLSLWPTKSRDKCSNWTSAGHPDGRRALQVCREIPRRTVGGHDIIDQVSVSVLVVCRQYLDSWVHICLRYNAVPCGSQTDYRRDRGHSCSRLLNEMLSLSLGTRLQVATPKQGSPRSRHRTAYPTLLRLQQPIVGIRLS